MQCRNVSTKHRFPVIRRMSKKNVLETLLYITNYYLQRSCQVYGSILLYVPLFVPFIICGFVPQFIAVCFLESWFPGKFDFPGNYVTSRSRENWLPRKNLTSQEIRLPGKNLISWEIWLPGKFDFLGNSGKVDLWGQVTHYVSGSQIVVNI